MKYVAISLIVLWGIGLSVLVFGRGRLRFYVNKRNLGIAAIIGMFGGVAWTIGDPRPTWLGKAGQIVWMVLVSVFLFGTRGEEHPDKINEREQKWIIDLPDKTVARLQLIGVAGAFLGSFVVAPAYALFWDGWACQRSNVVVDRSDRRRSHDGNPHRHPLYPPAQEVTVPN